MVAEWTNIILRIIRIALTIFLVLAIIFAFVSLRSYVDLNELEITAFQLGEAMISSPDFTVSPGVIDLDRLQQLQGFPEVEPVRQCKFAAQFTIFNYTKDGENPISKFGFNAQRTGFTPGIGVQADFRPAPTEIQSIKPRVIPVSIAIGSKVQPGKLSIKLIHSRLTELSCAIENVDRYKRQIPDCYSFVSDYRPYRVTTDGSRICISRGTDPQPEECRSFPNVRLKDGEVAFYASNWNDATKILVYSCQNEVCIDDGTKCP